MRAAAVLVALAGEGRAEPPAASPPPSEAPVIETIEETTVGELNGVRVPMGSMTTGTYALPGGREARGLICALALPGDTGVFVGMGSVVAVGGARWEVVAIEKASGEPGSVSLKRLD